MKNNLTLSISLFLAWFSCPLNVKDWIEWDGSHNLNMVSEAGNLPDFFGLGRTSTGDSGLHNVDIAMTLNVRLA
jgi:hypothetical protein